MTEILTPKALADASGDTGDDQFVRLGEQLFQWRDYTPIPLVLLLLFVARPTVFSATLGMCLIVFGEAIRLYSVAFIGSVSRTRTPGSGGSLITTGPFSIVRNPLYVGNFFITFGVTLYGGQLGFVVIAMLLFAFQYYCIVRFEETQLERKFPEEYVAYMEAVPRWFPSPLPSMHELQWPASFSEAIWSERRTFMAIAAVITLLLLKS